MTDEQVEDSIGALARGVGRGMACLAVACWALGLLVIQPVAANAEPMGIAEAETLVRSLHFEGLPEHDARRVGPEAAARLVEMLNDPEESAAYGNILLVLGLCGQPGSYQSIVDFANTPREGEVDRDTFRALQAVPYALGYAAEYEPRAVEQLERWLEADTPTWTFRHQRGARLHDQNRRAAATALGLTGLDTARAVLDRANVRASDVGFERHLREARAMNARRAARGRAR